MIKLQAIDICFAGVFMLHKVMEEVAIVIHVQDAHRVSILLAAN